MSTLHAPGVVGPELILWIIYHCSLLASAAEQVQSCTCLPCRQLKKAHPDCFIAADSSKAACEAAA